MVCVGVSAEQFSLGSINQSIYCLVIAAGQKVTNCQKLQKAKASAEYK